MTSWVPPILQAWDASLGLTQPFTLNRPFSCRWADEAQRRLQQQAGKPQGPHTASEGAHV